MGKERRQLEAPHAIAATKRKPPKLLSWQRLLVLPCFFVQQWLLSRAAASVLATSGELFLNSIIWLFCLSFFMLHTTHLGFGPILETLIDG